MTVIDITLLKSQLSQQPFTKTGIEVLRESVSNPSRLKRPFGIMYGVYGSTYTAANLSDYYGMSSHVSLGITSLVNISAILYKDKEYTKLLNTSYKVFPRPSYGLFALRDTLTIFSTFILKQDVIHTLDKHMPHNTADFIASFSLPILCQFVSTPIHILAIDLYANPSSTLSKRLSMIRSQYKSVCLGRVLRVVPAFCIGGFVNDMLRNRSMQIEKLNS